MILLSVRFIRCFAYTVMDKVKNLFSSSEDQKPGAERSKHRRLATSSHKRSSAGGGSCKLIIHLFAMSSSAIDNAIRDIDALLKKSRTIKALHNDAIVASVTNLSPEQVIGCSASYEMRFACDHLQMQVRCLKLSTGFKFFLARNCLKIRRDRNCHKLKS